MDWSIEGSDLGRIIRFFLFSRMSKLAPLRPTQPLHKWATGLSPRLNLLASEAVHLPPSSAKVKNEWRYAFTPPICLHGTWRERLTLYHTYSPSLCQHQYPRLYTSAVSLSTLWNLRISLHTYIPY
jgi:hypothetical protein